MRGNPNIAIAKSWITRVLFLGFAALLWGNVTGYMHPTDLCFINIQSALTGTAQTRSAIWKLRGEDRGAYKKLCKNISMIIEDSCYADSQGATHAVSACFILGSHIISIPTVSTANPATLQARAQALGILAEQAEDYWNE